MKRTWPAGSVRLRLTLWYLGAIAAILGLYAVGVFSLVRNSLRDGLDQRLHEDFEAVEVLLEPTAGGNIAWKARPHFEQDAEDRRIEVWSGARLLLRFPEGESQPPGDSSAPIASSGYRYTSVSRPDGSYARTITGPLHIGDLLLVMRVSRSEALVQRELRDLGIVLGIAWPAALAVAGLGGYLLARRALAPVDRMAERARSITADRLNERLPVDNPRDELGRLATVFNETLARLDEAFVRLKRFTADASHELRTPLTAMRSVGEVGLRERRDETAYRDVIGSMLEEVDRLTRLVDTLLTLSRADAAQVKPQREPSDLEALAREVCAHLSVLAEEKRQTLQLKGEARREIPVDRLLLRSALINLVHNAIKHGMEETEIAIEIAQDAETSTISVSDNGPGIAAADQQLVFERFYRVDKARSREPGGSGLGLAIARWAVEANGGRIELQSREGAGSTFRIVLSNRLPADAALGGHRPPVDG